MKKGALAGWRDVYAFQFVQTTKSKAFIITTAILCALALASAPIAALMAGDEEAGSLGGIRTVYVANESNLALGDFSGLKEMDERYGEIEFREETRSLEELSEELEQDGKAVLLHVTWKEEGYFNLEFVTGSKSGASQEGVRLLSEGVGEYFNEVRIRSLDVTPEQMAAIDVPIETEVLRLGEQAGGKEEGAEGITLEQYYVLLGVSVFLVFILSFGGESIASSIVTEKSNRVVEYLMTSIRPLAIITGKILAMLTLVLLQVSLLGALASSSSFVATALLGTGAWTKQGAGGLVERALEGGVIVWEPLSIALGVLIIIGGFLFYGTLAGLAGASVSRTEEMREGLKLYNLLLVVGTYLGIGLGIARISGSTSTGVSAFQAFCYLFPLSSPFVLPGNLLIGGVSLVWALGGLSLLALSLLVLVWFVAKVYEGMILYVGDRLKWKDVLRMVERGKD